jgi:glycosyltransferase involved in cell wall biosynthesis
MGAKGREFVTAAFGWGRIARQFVAMYEEVICGHADAAIDGHG